MGPNSKQAEPRTATGTLVARFLPVFVNEGVERHSVAPASGEVMDVDVWIAVKKHTTFSLIYTTVSSIMQTAVSR